MMGLYFVQGTEMRTSNLFNDNEPVPRTFHKNRSHSCTYLMANAGVLMELIPGLYQFPSISLQVSNADGLQRRNL